MDASHKIAGKSILLVESNQILSSVLQNAFVNYECRLVSVESAAKGLRLLKEASFDIIISDFNLPGIDGLEFFRFAASLCPAAVNIMITAYGDVDPVSRAYNAGVNGVIEKPFSFTALLAIISKHIPDQDMDAEESK